MAFDYQIDQGTFPTKDESDALQMHDAQDLIMTSGDFRGQIEATIEEFGSFRLSVTPPIRSNEFDVDSALSALRDASHALQFRRVFEIGLITRRANNIISKIDLIPSFPGVEATHTVWMVRPLRANESGEIVGELWSTLQPRRRKQKDVVKKEDNGRVDTGQERDSSEKPSRLVQIEDDAKEHVVYDDEKVVAKKEESLAVDDKASHEKRIRFTFIKDGVEERVAYGSD
ncbi:hypothetical protein TI39_contig490g00012 [Zymoseptoria brevis]|uniref:Uncharacterized protein n=1 Tax=Zymoseptoria brevis TaxID=1047168 RepID=A0A0F4GJ70_9PEZI|nr:hypothetical protein TI39_contig490g00012 [Zymoseptoria brevis]